LGSTHGVEQVAVHTALNASRAFTYVCVSSASASFTGTLQPHSFVVYPVQNGLPELV
jgi:hypothetical protein